jgi:hypothetical protein
MTELAAPTMTVTAPAAHALHVHLYRVSLFRIRHFRGAAGQGPGLRPEFRVCCIQTAPKGSGLPTAFRDQGGESNFRPHRLILLALMPRRAKGKITHRAAPRRVARHQDRRGKLRA